MFVGLIFKLIRDGSLIFQRHTFARPFVDLAEITYSKKLLVLTCFREYLVLIKIPN